MSGPMTDYPTPTDQLLRLGEAESSDEWRDYRALGLDESTSPT